MTVETGPHDWTRLRMPDGVAVRLKSPLAEVQATVQEAMAARQMIEVKIAGEPTILVNPLQVLYIEPWTDE